MKVIAVCSNKGGVGKTSIVYNLAGGLADKGKTVLCIDTDKQGNLTKIATGKFEGVTVKNATIDNLTSILSEATQDVCLIDCPPALDMDVARVLGLSNYMISPVRPDCFSIDAITNVQHFAKECGARAKLLAIPVNGVKATTVSKAVVAQLEKKAKASKVPVVQVKDSAKVAESMFMGRTIFVYKSPAKTGYEELLGLVLAVV